MGKRQDRYDLPRSFLRLKIVRISDFPKNREKRWTITAMAIMKNWQRKQNQPLYYVESGLNTPPLELIELRLSPRLI